MQRLRRQQRCHGRDGDRTRVTGRNFLRPRGGRTKKPAEQATPPAASKAPAAKKAPEKKARRESSEQKATENKSSKKAAAKVKA